MRVVLVIIIFWGLGSAGALFTAPSIPSWYAMLNKPAFTPPPWVFGPAWTLLYIMMGLSYAQLLQAKAKTAGRWMLGQFALNLMWTPVFLACTAFWAA